MRLFDVAPSFFGGGGVAGGCGRVFVTCFGSCTVGDAAPIKSCGGGTCVFVTSGLGGGPWILVTGCRSGVLAKHRGAANCGAAAGSGSAAAIGAAATPAKSCGGATDSCVPVGAAGWTAAKGAAGGSAVVTSGAAGCAAAFGGANGTQGCSAAKVSCHRCCKQRCWCC